MIAGGLNYGRIFKTDLAGLNSDTFINALGMGGVHAEKARSAISKRIQAGLAQGSELDILRRKASLEDDISGALGLKKGDAQNRRIIKKSIDNITATKQGGLDLIAFLEEVQKMPVASFKDLFGLHHATKGAVLSFKASLSQYKSNLEQVVRLSAGAIDEGLAVKLEGFAFQVDKLGAAWTFLKNSLSTTGSFGAALDKMSGAMIGIASMDPPKLDKLSKGITGLSLGLAGLAGASAGVWVLARLGAIMTGPLGKILAAGGLAALFGGITPQQFNVNGASQNGPAPLLDMFNEAAGLAGDLVGAMDDVAKSALGLAGIDFAGSTLITSLQLMTALLRDARQSLEFFKSADISNENKEWGIGDLFSPFNAQEYARKKRGDPAPEGRAWWNPMPERLPAPYDSWWDSFKNWSPDGMSSHFPRGAPSSGLDTSAVIQRLDSPLQVIMFEPPVAKLEGSGSVTVTVQVEGPGEVTGVSAADDGKNIKLNTGGGMSDTNR